MSTLSLEPIDSKEFQGSEPKQHKLSLGTSTLDQLRAYTHECVHTYTPKTTVSVHAYTHIIRHILIIFLLYNRTTTNTCLILVLLLSKVIVKATIIVNDTHKHGKSSNAHKNNE